MTCPPEIARVLLEILSAAAVSIRAAGWAGDARRCAALADHIHNLPSLLSDYSADRLLYYWDAEKPPLERDGGELELRWLQELWRDLRPFVEEARSARMS
jgi:hypothetical protein